MARIQLEREERGENTSNSKRRKCLEKRRRGGGKIIEKEKKKKNIDRPREGRFALPLPNFLFGGTGGFFILGDFKKLNLLSYLLCTRTCVLVRTYV